MMHDNDGSSASEFLPFVAVAIIVPIIAMTVLVAMLWGLGNALLVLGGMIVFSVAIDRIMHRIMDRLGP